MQREERPRVIGVAAIFFIAQAALYVGAPGVEGLFLTRYGPPALPYMYLLVGVAVPLTVLATSAGTARLRRRTLYAGVPVALAVGLAVSRLILIAEPRWFFPVLYVFMNLASTLTAFFSWGIAGAICTARQAKRLFPLFAAGGILGSSVGGLLTPVIVPYVGAKNLILMWAGLVAIAAALAAIMARGIPERSQRERRRTLPLEAIAQAYREVIGSRLFRVYAAMASLFVASFFLLAFTFSRLSVREFADDSSLAGFFGLFQGVATGTGLLLAVFVSARLFRGVGFLGSLIMYGAVFVAGFAISALWPAFAPVVAFRYMQVAVYLGIAGPAYQGVFNVVSSDSRERTRLLVDGVFIQSGMIVAGALLIGLNALPGLRLHFVAGALLALGALSLAAVSRSRYGSQVLSALRAGGAGLFDRRPWLSAEGADARGIRIAMDALQDADVKARRAAAGVLRSVASADAAGALVAALRDRDADVRRLAVEALSDSGAADCLLEVEPLLADDEPRVRRSAVNAVATLASYPGGIRRAVEPLVDDPDRSVRAAAAAALARLDDPAGRQRLERYLDSSDQDTVMVAMDALSLAPTAVPLDRVARFLRHDDPRIVAASASLLASIGSRAEEHLAVLLQNDALGDDVLADKVLGVYSDMATVTDSEPLEAYADACLRRVEACRELASLLRALGDSTDDGGSNLAVTESALGETARRAARHAIWARTLAAGHYDHLAVEGLSSEDPETRGYALEALDSLAMKATIRPALVVMEGRLSRDAPVEPASTREVFDRILDIEDSWLTACAVSDMGRQLEASDLERVADSASLVVADAARRIAVGGQPVKKTESISLMERILFLKETPLFAGLSPDALERVANTCEEHEFLKGEILDEEGAAGDCMFLIASGSVRIVSGTDHGELARRTVGDAIGEMALLSHVPRSATMIAAEPTKVLVVSHKAFEQILRRSPEVCLAVMQVLSDRLIEAERRHSRERNNATPEGTT
jgi:hypothetical protein